MVKKNWKPQTDLSALAEAWTITLGWISLLTEPSNSHMMNYNFLEKKTLLLEQITEEMYGNVFWSRRMQKLIFESFLK